MFPSQRSLDLHLQRFHTPLLIDSAKGAGAATGVRLEEVQLQMATTEKQQQHQMQDAKQLQQRSPHMPGELRKYKYKVTFLCGGNEN